MNLNDILISGKLGDGCVINVNANSKISFVCKHKDYLAYKKNEIEKQIKCSGLRTQKSGYKEGAFSYTFSSVSDEKITTISNLTVSECIKSLNKDSFTLLYLDDGSLHKSKHFIHLYCNSFSEDETHLLIDKIKELYPHPEKVPVLAWDKKRTDVLFLTLEYQDL